MLVISLWLCFKTSFSIQARCGVRTRVLSRVLGLMLGLDWELGLVLSVKG